MNQVPAKSSSSELGGLLKNYEISNILNLKLDNCFVFIGTIGNRYTKENVIFLHYKNLELFVSFGRPVLVSLK